MRIRTILVGGVWLGFLSISFVESCFAQGFDNYNIGIKSTFMGHALAGISDDASAVYHNPGGLVFMDRNTWQGEVYGYTGFAKCEYTANFITDRTKEPAYIPGLFISKTYDDWALGFGFYIPYAGGGTIYDNFQGSPYNLEAFAGWYCLTPSTAYKLRSNLAVGVGVSLYGGILEMESFDPSILAVVRTEYDGFSGYGAHIGVMYKPIKELSIGLVARSQINIEMDGTAKIGGMKIDSDVKFTLPASFTLGLGFQPQPNLTVGLYGCYRLYSDMPEMTFETSGTKRELKTYFKNALSVGVGTDYKMSNKLSLRAGLQYDPGPTKKEGLNPSFCDVAGLFPSMGIGYNITESIELNIGAHVLIGLDETYQSQKFEKLTPTFLVGIRFRYS